jgi:hypothetical protein
MTFVNHPMEEPEKSLRDYASPRCEDIKVEESDSKLELYLSILSPARARARPAPGPPTNWSVPSSEVTKCDTNTSPRRLVAHLLQQVESVFHITVTKRAR